MRRLRLNGIADAYAEQIANPETETFSFDERLGFLVDRERSDCELRKLSNRLPRARLRQQASVEDIDHSAARRLNNTVILALARCRYVEHHEDVLIMGAGRDRKDIPGLRSRSQDLSRGLFCPV